MEETPMVNDYRRAPTGSQPHSFGSGKFPSCGLIEGMIF
jgi:hypothetical protein